MPSSKRVIWARGEFLTTQCPKSIITSESLNFLDEFRIWKQLGLYDPSRLSAKSADALVILDEAWKETCREQIEKQFNGPR